jgi:hypothetical protein
MSRTKAASLTGSVIATKGTAAPSAEKTTSPAKDEGERIAVSVRLTPADYRKLKMYGVDRRMTNQEIIVTALDAYLSQDVKL